MTSAFADEYDYPANSLNADPSAPIDPATRAVIYLRVSSAGQVNTDYDPEGLSIPAQRVACQRKAAELGLTIVDEYVEPGRSGTEMTKRIAMQQMLTRVRQDKDVGYVIVYKLSRMARNRYDDAIVMADLRKRGIALISATEAVDDSPVGQLMHGILATFNEYQSRESGADISYKMGQKAKNGGTLGQARIGYLNVFDRSEGREIRTVIPDPERAELIKLAFELYASGEYTLADLSDELYDRGLSTRQTPRRPSKQVSINTLSLMLKDRYYLGRITYKGEEYPGRHEALIDEDLFDEVQLVMKARAAAGERRRVHHHYLKGSVFCGRCHRAGINQRLNIQHTVNPRGYAYTYFFCTNTRDGSCSSSHTNVLFIERAVEDHYATLKFSEQFIADVRQHITKSLDNAHSATRLLKRQLTNQLRGLDAKESNLIDLAADGTVPQTRIRQKLREIQRERERLTERLEVTNDDLVYDARLIEACLTLMTDPYELYLRCDDDQRRLLNQALFTGLYVEDDHVASHELKEPFASLRALHDDHQPRQEGEPPPDKRKDPSRRPDNKKAVSETGGGLYFMLLEGFNPGMASARSSNKPQMVESSRTYSHSEPLAKAIELLLIKLPDAKTPSRAPRKTLPQRVRKLLASEVAQMIDRYQQGATVVELAEQYGIDRETVRRAVRSAGLPAHPRGLTDLQIDEAVRLYASGQSLARIGDRFGVDAHTVRRRLLERGVVMRNTHRIGKAKVLLSPSAPTATPESSANGE